jgi:hypothetical protein
MEHTSSFRYSPGNVFFVRIVPRPVFVAVRPGLQSALGRSAVVNSTLRSVRMAAIQSLVGRDWFAPRSSSSESRQVQKQQARTSTPTHVLGTVCLRMQSGLGGLLVMVKSSLLLLWLDDTINELGGLNLW